MQKVQTQQDEHREDESSRMSERLLGLNREIGQGIKVSMLRAVTRNIWGISNVDKALGYLYNFQIIFLQETWLEFNRGKEVLVGLDKKDICQFE